MASPGSSSAHIRESRKLSPHWRMSKYPSRLCAKSADLGRARCDEPSSRSASTVQSTVRLQSSAVSALALRLPAFLPRPSRGGHPRGARMAWMSVVRLEAGALQVGHKTAASRPHLPAAASSSAERLRRPWTGTRQPLQPRPTRNPEAGLDPMLTHQPISREDVGERRKAWLRGEALSVLPLLWR